MADRLLIVETVRAEQRWLDRWTHQPTAADLAAYLQARPDLAVEVARRLKVAGPRQDGARWPIGVGHLDPVCLVTGGWRDGCDSRWAAELPNVGATYATEAEAWAVSEAAAKAEGWALAGGEVERG